MDAFCAVHNKPYERYRGMANGLFEFHCTWDGSLHPDVFMELIAKPGVVLSPTDKNYKVYIELEDGTHAEELRVISRANHDQSNEEGWLRVGDVDLTGVDTSGWGEFKDDEWIRISKRGSKIMDKFYFEHLSQTQRKHFVELLNENKMAIGYPGRFYVLPFFIR